MSNKILPYPVEAGGTDTPTPAQIEAALTLVGAEQVAPGVWTAQLSIGLMIRITDPAQVATPPVCDWESYDCGGECTDNPAGRRRCVATLPGVSDAD